MVTGLTPDEQPRARLGRTWNLLALNEEEALASKRCALI
jgi:hypothetical protein